MKKTMFLSMIFVLGSVFAADTFDKVVGIVAADGEKVRRAHESVEGQPTRAVLGTFTSPMGNTIQYTAAVADVIKDDFAMAMVNSLSDSGQCISDARYPNHVPVCAFILAGRVVTITAVSAPGELAGKTIFFLGQATDDVLGYWEEAFDACEDTMVPFGQACQAVSFVLDSTGKVVRSSAFSAGQYLRSGMNGAGYFLFNVISIPAGLFNFNLRDTGRAVGVTVLSAFCVVSDLTVYGLIGIVKNLFGKDHVSACDQIRQGQAVVE